MALSNPAEPLTSGNLPYTHKYACDITAQTMPHLFNNIYEPDLYTQRTVLFPFNQSIQPILVTAALDT